MSDLKDLIEKNVHDVMYDVIGLYVPGFVFMLMIILTMGNWEIYNVLGISDYLDVEILSKTSIITLVMIIMPYVIGIVLQGIFNGLFGKRKFLSDERIDDLHIRFKGKASNSDKIQLFNDLSRESSADRKIEIKAKFISKISKIEQDKIKKASNGAVSLTDKYIFKRLMMRNLYMGVLVVTFLWGMNLILLVTDIKSSEEFLLFIIKEFIFFMLFVGVLKSLSGQIASYTDRILKDLAS